MKNPGPIYTFLFIISILSGYWVGAGVKAAPTAPQAQETDLPLPRTIPTLSNGQRNILLIGVDQLVADEAILEGIWLVTFSSSSSSVMLWPVYPTLSNGIVYLNENLSSSFRLNQVNGMLLPEPPFFSELRASNFWWSGYIIFDKQAVIEVTDLLGGVSLQDRRLNGKLIAESLPDITDNPLEAYLHQARLLNAYCRLAFSSEKAMDWNRLIGLIPSHVISDLNADLLLAEWLMLTTYSGNHTCEFPLSGITP